MPVDFNLISIVIDKMNVYHKANCNSLKLAIDKWQTIKSVVL